MIKRQLFISLFVLLCLQSAQSRFLQTGPLINSNPYRSDLKCGECILGNYTFCVKGTLEMVVDTAPQSFCCQTATNCQYTKDPSWVCSSNFNNSVDKFKVCPFIRNQCGSAPNLNLTGVGDSQCIRIKGLQQGNACFYKVQSKCGVPDF